MADITKTQKFAPIIKIEGESSGATSLYVSRDRGTWVNNYKNAFLEHSHDTSQLTLIHPDDCLMVAGPARFDHIGKDTVDKYFHPIGFARSISYTETSDVQPLKAIGSRRHIFSKTNQPVQISIQRLMILGINTLRSLYGLNSFGTDITARNSKFSSKKDSEDGSWYSNLEEDIFRVPIGLGIIYNSPATLAGRQKPHAGAEYFEACVLVNKSVTIQSGDTNVMEQVTLYADRVIPWVHSNALTFQTIPLVQNVSQMEGPAATR